MISGRKERSPGVGITRIFELLRQISSMLDWKTQAGERRGDIARIAGMIITVAQGSLTEHPDGPWTRQTVRLKPGDRLRAQHRSRGAAVDPDILGSISLQHLPIDAGHVLTGG